MDFFEQQHHARRHTQLMVVMFAAAVTAVVVVLNIAGVIAWAITMGTPLLESAGIFSQAPRELYLGVTAATLAIIGFGSISALIKLSAGGAAVAEMVGARLVSRESRNFQELRLLNVVEEMSIASGITMPQVYIMDAEPAINAFAAGYSPNEAVVAVTRGTLEGLNRDELQGVIGHEFSHILNGDMRLNIRLLGVILGIVMIGALGRFLMNARSSSTGNSSRRDTDLRIFMVGLCLWLIGSVGVLAGRMIKAAISRQREFLADASSVQFTRNPEGIGTALYKIGRQNGLINDRHAEDLSHMYFGESVSSLFGLLNTHPPVDRRIERLMGPSAMPLLRDKVKNQPVTSAIPQSMDPPYPEGLVAAAADIQKGAALSSSDWGSSAATLQMTPQKLIDSVGHPTTAHHQAARSMLQQIPEALRLATRSADGARAVLFTLLLEEGAVREGAVRVAQLESIAARHGEKVANACAALQLPLRELGPRARMPIMELLIPSLLPLPQPERDTILAQVDELARTDRKLTIGEFVLLTLCRRHLAGPIKGAPPVKHANINSVLPEAGIVFSVLAHAGKGGIAAFARGMDALGLPGGVLRTPAELGMAAVEASLYELKLLAPLKKPAFIKACLAVVMHDGKLTIIEGELMRALCAALDSPLPPLLDTIEPALQ